jgi:hypothetical protein
MKYSSTFTSLRPLDTALGQAAGGDGGGGGAGGVRVK